MNKRISQTLSLPIISVENTITLLDSGATVPFITRYRKEMTRNLDETQIRAIKEKYLYFKELNERKNTILKNISDQKKLTNILKRKIENVNSKTELEDIYLPYKPTRKTRAVLACEKGLLPLAERILTQKDTTGSISLIVKPFIQTSVPTVQIALQSAQDIIAERINTDADLRKILRLILFSDGKIKTVHRKTKIPATSKYEMYYQYEEAIKSIPSHRLLAILRGEHEKQLKISWHVPTEKLITEITKKYIHNTFCIFKQYIKNAISDSLNRLLLPSLTTDIRKELKERSDRFAIDVFAKNLKHLLLAPPLGAQPVLALDPGFRTGIKVAVVDATAKLVFHDTIYPLEPNNRKQQALELIDSIVNTYKIKFVAIGNGTASRETEQFMNEYKKQYSKSVKCIVVSEAGASVFSVSEIAREEFPDLDATVRGAVCIGRRFQDPLAELVKIDPKSLGIGQYQHDVNQTLLKKKLDDTVEHCVNIVGVDLNTASVSLLSHTAGIGKLQAKNIVDYRNKHGAFRIREDLMNVPKFGVKAFEQSAGFLRIRNGSNPLDSSAIHPESYPIVKKILRDLDADIGSVMGNDTLIQSIKIEEYITQYAGRETLIDILNELSKPGIDPRETFKPMMFNDDIRKINDIREGTILPGIVTNIAHFGVFVDLGVHQDGLIHISNLSNTYVTDPCDVVKVGQTLKVKVLSVDVERKRIGLSLKDIIE